MRQRIGAILRRYRPAHLRGYMRKNNGQLPEKFVTKHPELATKITDRWNQRHQGQMQPPNSGAFPTPPMGGNAFLQQKFQELYNQTHPNGASGQGTMAEFMANMPFNLQNKNGLTNTAPINEFQQYAPTQPAGMPGNMGVGIGQIPNHQDMNREELEALRNQFREYKLSQLQANPNQPSGYNGASLNPWSFIGEEEVQNGRNKNSK